MICRIRNCKRTVENPLLGICNRCKEEIDAAEDRYNALQEAMERENQESLHGEKEDR